MQIRECRFVNKVLRIRIRESLFTYCENKDARIPIFMGLYGSFWPEMLCRRRSLKWVQQAISRTACWPTQIFGIVRRLRNHQSLTVEGPFPPSFIDAVYAAWNRRCEGNFPHHSKVSIRHDSTKKKFPLSHFSRPKKCPSPLSCQRRKRTDSPILGRWMHIF